MKTAFLAVSLLFAVSANAQVQYMYNYSNVPIAPVVQPIAPIAPIGGGNYNHGGYQSQQYNYRQPTTQVIQSGGQVAVCNTFNNVTTCF